MGGGREFKLLATGLVPYCRVRGEQQTREQQFATRRAAEAALGSELIELLTSDAQGRSIRNASSSVGPACGADARVLGVNMSAEVGCHHLASDGVHPSAAGAIVMARVWHRELAPLLLNRLKK